MIQAKGYAAQDKSSELAPWNFHRREVGPHDIQIAIRYCGVCHSDLHQIRDDWGGATFPMIPGHEIVGIVTNAGTHVKKVQAGQWVAVGNMVDSCRICDNCRQGLEQYCTTHISFTYNSTEQNGLPTYGGYSNIIVVHEDFVFTVSEKLDMSAVAPLLCAGITVYSPLRHWKVGEGHRLAVLGLGGLGHMAVKFGVAFGAEVTVLSTSPAKEADAKALGAHRFLVTRDAEQMKSAAGYFDFILDTVSADHAFDPYLALLRTNGTHIVLGLPSEPATFRLGNIVFGRKSMAGSLIGGIPETQEMLDYCAGHHIVADVELIDMKNIYVAFDRMVKGDVRYRFVIDMATL